MRVGPISWTAIVRNALAMAKGFGLDAEDITKPDDDAPRVRIRTRMGDLATEITIPATANTAQVVKAVKDGILALRRP